MAPDMPALTLLSTKIYACMRCGARSYHRVIGRDRSGAMRATSLYHCTGCSAVFTDRRAWRDGSGDPGYEPGSGATMRSRGSLEAT